MSQSSFVKEKKMTVGRSERDARRTWVTGGKTHISQSVKRTISEDFNIGL